MNRAVDSTNSCSLYPPPPLELVEKYSDDAVAQGIAPKPPEIPHSATYQTFGVHFNTGDPIIRPLEAFGFERVYPSNCNRKAELKKINFSILANYLDLLDIMSRNPGSHKRAEKLEHILKLFVNMHQLLNEYRPHQARDTIRSMFTNQVEISRKTVKTGEQFLARAVDAINSAVQAVGNTEAAMNFDDLGPELATICNEIQANLRKRPLKREDVCLHSELYAASHGNVLDATVKLEAVDVTPEPLVDVWKLLADLNPQ